MARQESERIVSTSDLLNGDPRIEGRRLSVLFIHEQVEGRGLDPQTVADRYDLDVADVYRALASYHENPEEMADIQARRERRHEKANTDPKVATGPDDRAEAGDECNCGCCLMRIPNGR